MKPLTSGSVVNRKSLSSLVQYLNGATERNVKELLTVRFPVLREHPVE